MCKYYVTSVNPVLKMISLEGLLAFFVLLHVRHHKMSTFCNYLLTILT